MKYLVFFQKVVLFFFSINYTLAGFLVPEDSDICTSFIKFGQDCHAKLDDIHENLAKIEQDITKELIKNGGIKTNNIVIASLTICLVDNSNNSIIKTFPIGLPRDTLGLAKHRVFESSLNLSSSKEYNYNYDFESQIIEVPNLLRHINDLWGKKVKKGKMWEPKEDLVDWEKNKIWEHFINFQEKISPLKDKLRNEATLVSLGTTSLQSLVVPLNNFAFLLSEHTRQDYPDQVEVVRSNTMDVPIDKEIELLKKRTKVLHDSLTTLQKKLIDIRSLINGFYNYFWHSEQRLIFFLLSPQSNPFWDDIDSILTEENLDNFIIKGAFLNLHSKFNFCQTCRRSLGRSVNGGLRDRFYNKLIKNRSDSQINDFFFKACGSFRIRYKTCLSKEKLSYWMSYEILDPNKILKRQDLFNFDSSPLVIKKIDLDTNDSKEKDEEYAKDLLQKNLEEMKFGDF